MSYDERCGSRAGNLRHWRRNEPSCEACLAAAAAYMAERRAADADIARRSVATARLRSRALSALARQHPEDYTALLNEQRRRERQSGASS